MSKVFCESCKHCDMNKIGRDIVFVCTLNPPSIAMQHAMPGGQAGLSIIQPMVDPKATYCSHHDPAPKVKLVG